LKRIDATRRRKVYVMSEEKTMLNYNDRVVIVTGAGGGLGRAHALAYAARGARVVVNDLGGSSDGSGADASAAGKVAQEIRDLGGVAIANTDSVATQQGGQAIVDAAVNEWGRLDVLVSNAGILRDRSFAKMSIEEFDSVLDVHLRGGFFVAQPSFRVMKEAGYGRIILTTSTSGLYGNFGQSNYGAAKLGLVGLMRTMAIEGQKSGITVNAIAPTAATRLTLRLGAPGENNAMSPDRVTPIVLALTHDTSTVNGEAFLAGGGWFSRAILGMTHGWTGPSDRPATEGEILNHWDDIAVDPDHFEPVSALDLADFLPRGD
jgi:NAD(P)-dependent dehydrogenase (short-subunit alcohol dehydrogenase family)